MPAFLYARCSKRSTSGMSSDDSISKLTHALPGPLAAIRRSSRTPGSLMSSELAVSAARVLGKAAKIRSPRYRASMPNIGLVWTCRQADTSSSSSAHQRCISGPTFGNFGRCAMAGPCASV